MSKPTFSSFGNLFSNYQHYVFIQQLKSQIFQRQNNFVLTIFLQKINYLEPGLISVQNINKKKLTVIIIPVAHEHT